MRTTLRVHMHNISGRAYVRAKNLFRRQIKRMPKQREIVSTHVEIRGVPWERGRRNDLGCSRDK